MDPLLLLLPFLCSVFIPTECGDLGLQGPDGNGSKGLQGVGQQGAMGLMGPKGTEGEPGIKGETGPRGLRNPFQGFITAGGWNGDNDMSSVELWSLDFMATCRLPDLPIATEALTLDLVGQSLIACGGYNTEASCYRLTGSGGWELFFTTVKRRYDHSSWVTGGSLYLMGGEYSPQTTEIVPLTVGAEEGDRFSLQHDVYGSCSISTPIYTYVTGGYDESFTDLSTVTRYNAAGDYQELPQFNTPRYRHACGSYRDGDKEVLLVVGGYDLASTEVHTLGSNNWRMVGNLPTARYGLRGVSLDSRVFVTGARDGSTYYRDVLEFDKVTGQWTEVGLLTYGRYMHGMAGGDVSPFLSHCSGDN